MSSLSTNPKFINTNTLLVIVLLLIFLIASRKCVAQVIADKEVLIYLFKEVERAKYLDKVNNINDSTILQLSGIISDKDEMIVNRNRDLAICEMQYDISVNQIKLLEQKNKKLHNKVILFKTFTVGIGLLGLISTTYFFFH